MFDFASDMSNLFLQSGFEEPVVYTASGGSPATISAVVFRTSESTINFQARHGESVARLYKMEIYISITDIPIVKVNADTVSFKRFPQDAVASSFRIGGIVHADAGGWRLGLL